MAGYTNAISVSNIIAENTTEFLDQGSTILATANRDFLQSFNQMDYMTGGSIDIKLPGYPAVQMGLETNPTEIQDFIVPYVITPDGDLYNVVRNLNLFQQRFSVRGGATALTSAVKKAIVDNYAYPAYISLSTDLEKTAALRMRYTAYLTPIDGIEKLGSINTYSDISQIQQMMDYLNLSMEDRTLMMNLADARAVSDSMQNMFNETINSRITYDALVNQGPKGSRIAGMDAFKTPRILTFTAGALASTSGYSIGSVAADGSTITIKGVPSTSSKLVNAGDMISIPSVNLVNSITGEVLPYRLVVTAAQDANGDGSGNVTVILSYPLMASGEHANVNALPAVNAPIMVYPNRNDNFAYVKSGLSAVPVELGKIEGAANSTYRGKNGVTVQTVIQGQVLEYQNIYRTSLMCGIQAFAPYIVNTPSLAA